ncbi:MAG: sensor histidine kinase [Phenylobacterium sp.]|nr:sensor histidine kinase [Phenylobacterium sp.]
MDDAAAAVTAKASPDFAALFRTLPSPYMVLDAELNFVEANAAYCEVTEHRREQLIGHHLFDLFPNNGHGGERLRESFARVLQTGQPHSLPLIPYPIPLPISRGGGFELRYWSAVHTPLLDGEGRPRFIVQNTVDVTELQRLRQMAFGPGAEPQPGESDVLQRVREVEAINEALAKETQGLRDLFMQAPGFMAVLSGPELTFALVNTAYQQLIGHRPVIGRPVREALPEVIQQGFPEILQRVMRDREPFIGKATSVLLQRTPDGPLEERFLDFIYQPIVGASGQAWGIFVEGSDVTDRVMGEQQQKLLLDELNHRVKNTLATVQAIAAQTLSATSDPAVFKQDFEARLMALSATHDLLTATSWRSAALTDVLRGELKPYGGERYRLAGPELDLAPAEALTLGLIFHELATNAAKHGALSQPGGWLAVSWSLSSEGEARTLDLLWQERDGPSVAPPTRRGFGSRLIERSLGGAGASRLEFAAEGLVCRIAMRLRP